MSLSVKIYMHSLEHLLCGCCNTAQILCRNIALLHADQGGMMSRRFCWKLMLVAILAYLRTGMAIIQKELWTEVRVRVGLTSNRSGLKGSVGGSKGCLGSP